jgi:hypothetical protein
LKGFQYLEQRDTQDAITKEGVVSKKTPFATADNAGIYDTIAENFRYLKDELDNITNTSEISSIRDEVKNMYEQMKTDGNFGEVAAKAQAQEALKQAKAAAESASKASASEQNVQNNTVVANNLLEDVKTKISETKSMLDRIKELAKAGEVKLQETETSIKGSEQNVKSLEASTKAAEANVVSMTSEVNGALTEIRTLKKNARNYKNEANASASLAQNLFEETMTFREEASGFAEESRRWAMATGSPDDFVDIESPSGKTASSRSWAIESKKKATDAIKALEAIKDLHATVMSAKEVAVKAEQSAKAIQSIIDVAMGTAQQSLADIRAIQKTIVSPVAWKGVVESYSDLPQNPERGWIYCIKTANEEHNVRAGDCLIWNGTSWDNAGKFVDMTQFAKIGDNVKFGEINGYTTPEGTGTFVVTNGNETRLGNTLKVGNITVSESPSGLDVTSENGQAYLGVKTAAASTADTADNANKLGGKTLQEIGNIITDVQTTLTSSISKVKQDGDNAIKSAIDSIRGMSPDALNTLQKIANAINNDASFATTIANALDGKANKNETYSKGEVYSKNETNQSYRKIGNRIVGGDVDWNTLTEPATYKIQGVVMDAAHHAPSNEYNFGLLVVNRLENGADGEWRTVQTYFPHRTRGYWSRMYNGPADYRAENWLEWRYIPTHNEVETIAEQKASTKVSKNGDTINGRIVFAHDTNNKNTLRSIFPAHYYHNYWHKNQRGVYIHAYPLDEPPEGDTYFAFRVGEGNKRYHEYTFDKNGLSLNGKDLWSSSIYVNDWFRVNENGGIHWQKYGGGWHMTDKDWIRAYNGKNIYTTGAMKANNGFEGNLRGTADNANKLGGYTLEQVIAMAK